MKTKALFSIPNSALFLAMEQSLALSPESLITEDKRLVLQLKDLAKLKQRIADLRAAVSQLQNEVIRHEAFASSLGDEALVMPEDLGDWSKASPRLQGIVTRIQQTHDLSEAVTRLRNTERTPKTNSTPIPQTPSPAPQTPSKQ